MVKKRLARSLVVAALAAGVLPFVGASPAIARAAATTHRFHVEDLRADFILPTGTEGTYRWMGVSAERVTDMDTGRVWIHGYPFRGTCEGDESGYGMSCIGAGVKGWSVTRFEADSAMAAALLVMKRDGRRIKIAFTGTQPFAQASSTNENNCGGSTTDVFVLARNAVAEGRLFGRQVSTAKESDGNRAAETMRVSDRTKECP